MWWVNDALNLLVDMGMHRRNAGRLVEKVVRDQEMTADEAGKWAKVVTMLGGVVAMGLVARPSTSARIIQAQSNAMVGMMRAAAGIPPRGFCHREFWYPRPGKGNAWDLIRCPLGKGHKGLHADENGVPFMAEQDIPFFNQQHRIATEV